MRADLKAISELVAPGTRVLDLGCGDGVLLRHLQDNLCVTGYGIEIEPAGVVASIGNGINVIQMNLEAGLSGFDEHSFDTVILSQTLQAMKHTEPLLRDMLRVGRECIVTFPNFGYWKNRLQVLAGVMPKSSDMPYEWYNTPNVHLCTLHDFEALCQRVGARVLQRIVISNGKPIHALPNLLGSLAVYRVSA